MILIGMFDSPFTRRVAISATLLGVDFEHRNWSVGRDFDRIREFNPQGRVPTLLTVGEFDEANPATIRRQAAMTPGAQVVVIPGAAHITTWDNPDFMLNVVRTFLAGAD